MSGTSGVSLKGKTFFITGASRGIGKAIAMRLAAEGANIVVAAKSIVENPKLGGTIFSAASEIEAAGGNVIATACDIRNEDQIQAAIERAVQEFGGIDGVINNASAISLTNTQDTEVKRFDLMHDINVRGTFFVTRFALPWLQKSSNPHILTLSPPLNIDPKWLGAHVAYTISKFNMSMMSLGWAAEFRASGIAANSLWPATTIATAAVQNLLGGEALIQRSRKPEIVAEAAFHVLSQLAKSYSGQLLLDEEVLRSVGITDFSQYAIEPGAKLQKDLFL